MKKTSLVPTSGLVTGKFCLVVDGSPGNPYTTIYASLRSFPLVTVQNDWTVAFDVTNAYHPVLLFSKLSKVLFGYFDPENIFLR